MNETSLERLDGMIREASSELFAAYGVPLRESSPGDAVSDDAYAATIGFTHPEVRGALIMTMCRDMVVRSFPAQIARVDPGVEAIADWTGELANQLLGRIKKKLSLFGVDITLSTPVVFKGNKLSHFPQHPKVSRMHGFNHESGHLDVELQAFPEEGLELDASRGSAGPAMDEGEVSLF